MSETGEVSKSVPAFGQLINIEKKPAPETVANFQNYIYKGGMFIKEHRYEEATEHFMNEEELVKVGRGFGEAREIFIDKIPRPDEYDKLANLVAKNSWNKDGGWIELSKINYYTVTGPDGLPQRRKQILPERLQHDIALIYMEE